MNAFFYGVFFLGFHFFLLRFSLLFQKKERKYEPEYTGRQLSDMSSVQLRRKSINEKLGLKTTKFCALRPLLKT